MKKMMILAGVLAVTLGGSSLTWAQTPEAPAPPAQQRRGDTPNADAIPISVQVLLERFQGTKKISSLPYTLSAFAAPIRSNPTQLRIGAQVPVPTAFAQGSTQPVTVQYRDVGTSIDCAAQSPDSQRFLLYMTIEDSWVAAGDAAESTVRGQPSFKSFKTSQQVNLRDGQSTQFTTATDKTNGEVVKVTVKLDVVK